METQKLTIAQKALLENGFREFDQADWECYAGCESKNPLIFESDHFTVIYDNARSISVNANTSLSGEFLEIPLGAFLEQESLDLFKQILRRDHYQMPEIFFDDITSNQRFWSECILDLQESLMAELGLPIVDN